MLEAARASTFSRQHGSSARAEGSSELTYPRGWSTSRGPRRRLSVFRRISAVGDGEDLHLPDASFDLVICNSVLHWFGDFRRAVAGFARVLRPGGQLAIASLASPAFHEWTNVVSAAWARRGNGASAGWYSELPNAYEIQVAVQAAGFSIEVFKYQVNPVVIREIPPFVSSMAVISPNWLGADASAARAVTEEVTRELSRRLPGGFCLTNANVDVVARKPNPTVADGVPQGPDLRTLPR